MPTFARFPQRLRLGEAVADCIESSGSPLVGRCWSLREDRPLTSVGAEREFVDPVQEHAMLRDFELPSQPSPRA
jgi:hypothetical protein